MTRPNAWSKAALHAITATCTVSIICLHTVIGKSLVQLIEQRIEARSFESIRTIL